eukprot:Stramenopile-MAST_4_protein_3003
MPSPTDSTISPWDSAPTETPGCAQHELRDRLRNEIKGHVIMPKKAGYFSRLLANGGKHAGGERLFSIFGHRRGGSHKQLPSIVMGTKGLRFAIRKVQVERRALIHRHPRTLQPVASPITLPTRRPKLKLFQHTGSERYLLHAARGVDKLKQASKYLNRLNHQIYFFHHNEDERETIGKDHIMTHNDMTEKTKLHALSETIKSLRSYYDPDGKYEDNPYFSDIGLLRREAVRWHPRVRSILHQLWLVVPKDGPKKDCVGKGGYIQMCTKVYCVLVDDSTAPDVVALRLQYAEEDWEIDRAGFEFLNEERFARAWFQLADHWTPDIHAALYGKFLEDVYTAIVHMDENTAALKEDNDVAGMNGGLENLGLGKSKHKSAFERSSDWWAHFNGKELHRTPWDDDEEATAARRAGAMGKLTQEEIEFNQRHSKLHVGQRVRAIYHGGRGGKRAYMGSISAINEDGTYAIEYDNALFDTNLERQYIWAIDDNHKSEHHINQIGLCLGSSNRPPKEWNVQQDHKARCSCGFVHIDMEYEVKQKSGKTHKTILPPQQNLSKHVKLRLGAIERSLNLWGGRFTDGGQLQLQRLILQQLEQKYADKVDPQLVIQADGLKSVLIASGSASRLRRVVAPVGIDFQPELSFERTGTAPPKLFRERFKAKTLTRESSTSSSHVALLGRPKTAPLQYRDTSRQSKDYSQMRVVASPTFRDAPSSSRRRPNTAGSKRYTRSRQGQRKGSMSPKHKPWNRPATANSRKRDRGDLPWLNTFNNGPWHGSESFAMTEDDIAYS